jgi:hypothetical protein
MITLLWHIGMNTYALAVTGHARHADDPQPGWTRW